MHPHGRGWPRAAGAKPRRVRRRPVDRRPPDRQRPLQCRRRHRRVTAARIGGVEEVPVLIRKGTRAEAIRDSLIENLHQETLDDIDQARGIKALAEEWGLSTNKEIAEKLNLKGRRTRFGIG
jgi:hypothetical protein